MSYGFKIITEGDYACFTRPEMKVERVSYEVPTPGALEGLLKSIYWKPAIRYVIDEIIVFRPIQFVNIRRNEVKEKIRYARIRERMVGGEADPSVFVKESVNQRNAMILKNVKYGIGFHFEMTGMRSQNPDEGEDKHYSILARRLERGQVFRQPCFGCREFSVKQIIQVKAFSLGEIDESLKGDMDLGCMLYHMKFADSGQLRPGADARFSDMAAPVYYHPHLVDGVIDVGKYRRTMIC